METLTFTCKIITPMFLAGADGKTPELRAASIKGALRFWWRAVQREADPKALKAKEDAIFGGVGNGKEGKAQRSKVRLRVRDLSPEINGTFTPLPNGKGKYLIQVKNFKVNILEYLAYGTYEWDKGAKRNKMIKGYFPVEKRFEINVSCPRELVSDISQLMRIISQVGGFGAKSRNGFGRFIIEEDASTVNWEGLFQGDVQDYTSFSSSSERIEIGEMNDIPLDTLAELGMAYKDIRSKMDSPHVFANRKYLGAPLMEGKVNRADLERHGKQIFFGIGPSPAGGYQGYFLVLPYNYLGGGDKVKTDKYHKAIQKFIANAK